jgi:hypothetical protein
MAELWSRLTRSLGADRRRDPPPEPSAVQDAPELERGAQGFARWDAALSAVREQVSSPAGQWFLDALAWPVIAMWASAGWHREGPLPPVEVIGEVLRVLDGGDIDPPLLHELEDADEAVLSLRDWPRMDAAAVARFRCTCEDRVSLLGAPFDVAEEPAHRQLRHALREISSVLPQEEARLDVAAGLASARWWPGRAGGLRHDVAVLTDPLRLASVGRALDQSPRRSMQWHEALGLANSLARGEGLPPIDPSRWIVSALAYRTRVLDELRLEPARPRVVRPDGRVVTWTPRSEISRS